MAAIDVRCEDVSKRYYVRRRRRPGAGSLGDLFGRRAPDQEFWALRDVGFEAGRGETLGIVGRNGAGKSTLLKLLGGITAPTRGVITLAGKISAMIEVGSGFHPELTGRENVFLSGAILGMRRREIAARLDSIATSQASPRSSTRRSSTTRRGCTCAWGSRSPHISRPTSFSSTRCWRWATPSSRHDACGGSRSSSSVGRR